MNHFNRRKSSRNIQSENTAIGKVSQTTDKDVTIDNPDGTKTVVPVSSGLLSKDDKGQLILNKAAAATQFKSSSTAIGHTNPNAPDPIRTPKLSGLRRG